MAPKKDPSQTNKPEDKKDEDKKKRKPRRKGEGMGGTIGLFPKTVKHCPLPCVTSFTRPSICCPQEMPMCCPSPPSCPQMICPGSPPPCCPSSNCY